MDSHGPFLEQILHKIARRYELKGQLCGTMKLGKGIDSSQLTVLNNFFGLAPIRVSSREEVRLNFDTLLKSCAEPQLLEKIADNIGYLPALKLKPEYDQQVQLVIDRLRLAYPDLEELIDFLTEKDRAAIERMLVTRGEEWVSSNFFKVAETIRFVVTNKEPLTISELGARFFSNSKALRQGEMRALLLQWLRLYSFDSELLKRDEDVWAYYNLLNDRLTVSGVIYGPIIYEKNGKVFDWIYKLYEQGEAATIGWSNVHDIDTMYFKLTQDCQPNLICSENEAPFSQLMRQQPNNCLLFTSGFPGSTVQKLYSFLAPHAANCYHWGDSDPAGLRIAAIINSIYPLELYRCDLTTLQDLRSALIPLSQKQKDTCIHLLTTIPDFPFAKELLFTLENGWLEQESWR
jgi:hypothetical protein